MDRFYAQFKMIFGEQDQGEGPRLTGAQIHEIGARAVENALELQSDELTDLPDNERELANAA
jgi:hypothetical protein